MKDQKTLALEFATHAHHHRHPSGMPQVRKYSGSPYIVHPIEVATLASDYLSHDNLSEQGFIVGILHDTVEDTDVTIEEIKELFGEEIATMVSFVTDVSKPSDGKRRARKKMDREHAAKGCRVSQTVKVCDIMSNARSISTDEPDFAAVYVPEKLVALNCFRGAVAEARRACYHVLVDAILETEKSGYDLKWNRVIA